MRKHLRSDHLEKDGYKYIGTDRTKAKAEAAASNLRKGGMAATVALNGYGFYNVYARPRKHR